MMLGRHARCEPGEKKNLDGRTFKERSTAWENERTAKDESETKQEEERNGEISRWDTVNKKWKGRFIYQRYFSRVETTFVPQTDPQSAVPCQVLSQSTMGHPGTETGPSGPPVSSDWQHYRDVTAAQCNPFSHKGALASGKLAGKQQRGKGGDLVRLQSDRRWLLHIMEGTFKEMKWVV